MLWTQWIRYCACEWVGSWSTSIVHYVPPWSQNNWLCMKMFYDWSSMHLEVFIWLVENICFFVLSIPFNRNALWNCFCLLLKCPSITLHGKWRAIYWFNTPSLTALLTCKVLFVFNSILTFCCCCWIKWMIMAV